MSERLAQEKCSPKFLCEMLRNLVCVKDTSIVTSDCCYNSMHSIKRMYTGNCFTVKDTVLGTPCVKNLSLQNPRLIRIS